VSFQLDADDGGSTFFTMIRTNAPGLWNYLGLCSFTKYCSLAREVQLIYDLKFLSICIISALDVIKILLQNHIQVIDLSQNNGGKYPFLDDFSTASNS
jgi:hypothetical protein